MKCIKHIFLIPVFLFTGLICVYGQDLGKLIPFDFQDTSIAFRDSLLFGVDTSEMPLVSGEFLEPEKFISFMPVINPDEKNVIAIPNATADKEKYYFMEMNPLFKPGKKIK